MDTPEGKTYYNTLTHREVFVPDSAPALLVGGRPYSQVSVEEAVRIAIWDANKPKLPA